MTDLQQVTLSIYNNKINAIYSLNAVNYPTIEEILDVSSSEAKLFLEKTKPEPLKWMRNKNEDLLSMNGEFFIVGENKARMGEKYHLYGGKEHSEILGRDFATEDDAVKYANSIRTK